MRGKDLRGKDLRGKGICGVKACVVKTAWLRVFPLIKMSVQRHLNAAVSSSKQHSVCQA